MRVSQRLIDALNEQVGNEMFASMKYLSIASYFDGETLPTLARFFFRQSEEEREHAMKFLRFLLDTGASVEIPAVPVPPHHFDSAENAVETALKGEKEVTSQIENLVRIADEDNNFTARNFLNWFLEEQLEEEDSVSSLLDTVRRAGSDRLLDVEAYLDREGLMLSESGPEE